MKTSALSVTLACVVVLTAAPLAAQRLPVPVTGRTTEVTLLDGTRLQGELIEATPAGLLLAGVDGRVGDLGRVGRVRVRQHDFNGGRAALWVGIGAVVSGLGMAAACTQVDDTNCGAVFPAVAISFGIIGGLWSIGMTSSGWREVPVDVDALRAFARFPQGAPPGFSP